MITGYAEQAATRVDRLAPGMHLMTNPSPSSSWPRPSPALLPRRLAEGRYQGNSSPL